MATKNSKHNISSQDSQASVKTKYWNVLSIAGDIERINSLIDVCAKKNMDISFILTAGKVERQAQSGQKRCNVYS